MYNKALKILNHAYTQVPLYIDLKNAYHFNKHNIVSIRDWYTVPLTDKMSFLKSPQRNIASNYMIDVSSNKCITMSTSYTTGECLNVYWNKDQFHKAFHSIEAYRDYYYRINSKDSFCYFYDGHMSNEISDGDICFVTSNTSVGFSNIKLSEANLLKIYEKIYNYDPSWLSLPSSIAMLLANIVQKYNLHLLSAVRYIEITGELLRYEEKKIIESIFNCRVVNNYSINEAGVIAYECPCGKLHCVCDNVLVETLNNGAETPNNYEGDIYITSFNNKVMPFVRYRTGNRGILNRKYNCKCGNPNPVLEVTQSFHNDLLINHNNERINIASFAYAVDKVNQQFNNCIFKFQIVQSNMNDIEISFMVNSDIIYNNSAQNRILEVFSNNFFETLLQGFNFKFKFVNQLNTCLDNNCLKYCIVR